MTTDMILKLVQDNWIILLVVYLLKPDVIYSLIDKVMVALKLKSPNSDDVTPGGLDLIDLLGLLVRRNGEEGLGAEKEIQALAAKLIAPDITTTSKK